MSIQQLSELLKQTNESQITSVDILAILVINILIIFVIKSIFIILNFLEGNTNYLHRLKTTVNYLSEDKMSKYQKKYVLSSVSSFINYQSVISYFERVIYIICFLFGNVTFVMFIILIKVIVLMNAIADSGNKRMLASNFLLELLLNVLFALIIVINII